MGSETLSPRERLALAPYAYRALIADTATTVPTTSIQGDVIAGTGVTVTNGDNVLYGSDATDVNIAVNFGGSGSATTASRTDHTHAGVYDNYSSWSIAASGTAGSSTVSSGETVTFSGTGTATVTRSGDNITINAAGDGVGITSINSQTGPAYTIAAGTGLTALGGTNIVTLSLASPVAIANGGTNNTSYTASQFLWYNSLTGRIEASGYNASSFATSGHTHSYVSSVTASSPLASSGGLTPNISLTGIVPIANGGTNASSFSATSQFIWYDGTRLVTSGYGAGSFLSGSGTATQVAFWNSSSSLTSNSNLYWDNTNACLGITGAPNSAYKLHVLSGNAKLGNSTTSSMNKLYFGDGGYVFVGEDVADDRLALYGNGGVSIYDGSGYGSAGQVLTSDGTLAYWETPYSSYVSSVTASSPLASSGGLTPNISLTGIVPIANGGTNASSFSATSQFIWYDGTRLVTSGYGAGSFLSGSGTATQVAFWNSSSSLTSNSNLYWDNTNACLGIAGTPSSAYKLHVLSGNAKLGNTTTSSMNKLYFGDGALVYVGEDGADDRLRLHGSSITITPGGSPGTSGQVLTSNGTTCYWATPTGGIGGSGTTNYVARWTASTTLGTGVLYDNGTNVGIGITTPYAKLQVNNFKAGSYTSSANDYLTAYAGYGAGWDGSNWRVAGDGANNAGAMIASSIGNGKIYFYTFPTSGGTDQSIADASINNYRRMTIDGSGNVGIGTTTPAYKLDVSGGVTRTAGGLIIETRTSDPASPENGRIWLRVD